MRRKFVDYSQPFTGQHKVVIANVVDEVSPSLCRLTYLGSASIPKVRWERVGTCYHGGHCGHHPEQEAGYRQGFLVGPSQTWTRTPCEPQQVESSKYSGWLSGWMKASERVVKLVQYYHLHRHI